VAFEPLLAPIAATVTDYVTVEVGARYTHAARPVAGFDGDIAEAETHVVRRLVGGREVRISMKAMA
jgi:hypothetical protein